MVKITNDFKQSRQNINCSMGNRLVEYFTHLGENFRQGKDFHFTNFENTPVLKKLPTFLPCDEIIRNELNQYDEYGTPGDPYYYVSRWELMNDKCFYFWKTLKPLATRLMNDIFLNSKISFDVKHPVIHFRCSDVPFLRHPPYYFQRYAYFVDSLNYLKSQNIDVSKVYIMTNNKHGNGNVIQQKKARLYLYYLSTFLEKKGFPIEIVSTSDIEDFSILYNAPAVISTCSSFSFMGGFFGKGIFITEGHYDETKDEKFSKCTASCVKKGYSINHNLIQDYLKVNEVVSMLMR